MHRTDSSISVVLVISNLEFGGAQRQMVELVNSSDDLDVEYHIVSLSEHVPLASQLVDKRKLHIIQKRFKYDVTVPIRLAALLRKLKSDVVHGVLFDAEIASRIASRIANTRAMVGSERNTGYKLKRTQLLASRMTKGFRKKCIANSSSGARFNSKLLGYQPSHYAVVYNGVDVQRFRPRNKGELLNKLDLDANARWIGMVGSFKKQKNQTIFIEVARQIADEYGDVRFLLVGDALANAAQNTDIYKNQILAMISKLGLSEQITIKGNTESVEDIYPVCEMTILPSLFEGTPNVALESMASAVPVIASDVSDNSRIIPDGEVGFIVPVNDIDATADAVRQLLMPDVASQFGRRARAWVTSEYNTAKYAENMLEAYRQAL